MEIVAYIRVSTHKQDLESQKLAVMTYAQKEGFLIDEFHEITISSRKKDQRKNFDELAENLQAGDTLIVSEISRVGRSLGVIVNQINNLVARKVNFISVKEGLKLSEGKQDMQSKIIIGMFGLFAEIERDLTSERTKEGMERAKKAGKKIGRPKGKGKSLLDGKEQEIANYLDRKVSKLAISRILGVSYTALNHFIKTRNLEAGGLINFKD